MNKVTARQRNILLIVMQKPKSASSDIAKQLKENITPLTVKRDLAALVGQGFLIISGKGPATTYSINPEKIITLPIDAHEYVQIDPDTRSGATRYDHNIFEAMPKSLFGTSELAALKEATNKFQNSVEGSSDVFKKKELERFVVEFSWKSSKIEGNTYTLLDTERLIKEGIVASGHTQDETNMVLNHKSALQFILANRDLFSGSLTLATVEDVHEQLVENLGIARGLRGGLAAITGSTYRPLDNTYQIRDAMKILLSAEKKMTDTYSKALLLLAGVSYIQPFEDGNKRTARLVANGILLVDGLAPLSYRSVDEVAYKEAMLAFYEVHTIEPVKQMFLEQYRFAATEYSQVFDE